MVLISARHRVRPIPLHQRIEYHRTGLLKRALAIRNDGIYHPSTGHTLAVHGGLFSDTGSLKQSYSTTDLTVIIDWITDSIFFPADRRHPAFGPAVRS